MDGDVKGALCAGIIGKLLSMPGTPATVEYQQDKLSG